MPDIITLHTTQQKWAVNKTVYRTVGCSEVVQSVMKCIYAPGKMTLCINVMEFGTKFGA
jgi:hypothetical protein